jgi:hypothetical protein
MDPIGARGLGFWEFVDGLMEGVSVHEGSEEAGSMLVGLGQGGEGEGIGGLWGLPRVLAGMVR